MKKISNRKTLKKLVLAVFLILIILMCFSSCTRKSYCERKKNKVARILKDCPGIIESKTTVDTVFVKDTFNLTIPAKIDTGAIDSLLLLYCDALRDSVPVLQSGKDSVRTKVIKQLIYKECSPEKVIGEGNKLLVSKGDTLNIHFKGTPTGLELSIVSHKKQINKTVTKVLPCPEDNIFDRAQKDWIMWVIILVMGIILGVYMKKN